MWSFLAAAFSYPPHVVQFLAITSIALVIAPLLNALGLIRPQGAGQTSLVFLVPARNEERNIARLLQSCQGQNATFFVYDDESEDNTAEVASALNAFVVRSAGPPPEGWRGKPWACSKLREKGLIQDVEWLVYLDADLEAEAGFVQELSRTLARAKPDTQLVTGFPRFGKFDLLENVVSNWAIWLMLVSCPFWLIRLSGFRRPYFANGQIMAFRHSFLSEHDPFAICRGEVLEDVKIARWMGRSGHKSEVFRLADILTVHMYANSGEAFIGYRKNAVFIAGGARGTAILACLMLALGLSALAYPLFDVALIVSLAITLMIVRRNLLSAIFAPMSLAVGAWILIASWLGHRKRKLEWKGRPLS